MLINSNAITLGVSTVVSRLEAFFGVGAGGYSNLKLQSTKTTINLQCPLENILIRHFTCIALLKTL